MKEIKEQKKIILKEINNVNGCLPKTKPELILSTREIDRFESSERKGEKGKVGVEE